MVSSQLVFMVSEGKGSPDPPPGRSAGYAASVYHRGRGCGDLEYFGLDLFSRICFMIDFSNQEIFTYSL